MLFRIAVRNIFRNRKSSLLIVVFTAFMCMLFMLAGSLVTTVQKGLYRSFRSNITGDFVVMAKSDVAMSLFGANVPAIGEYFEIPALAGHDGMVELIESLDGTEAVTSQISGSAMMDINGKRYPVPFFGIDFEKQFSFFPAMGLLSGTLPGPGERGVLLSRYTADRVAGESGKAVSAGGKIKLNTLGPDGFRIRELRVAGIYSYSGTGPAMDQIVLTDVHTARELNSILVSEYAADIPDEETNLLDDDFDALFGDSAADSLTGSETASALSILDQVETATAGPEAASPEQDNGSWQFIIIRVSPSFGKKLYLQNLKTRLEGFDVRVLDWRQAAGSSSSFAWVLQLLFSISMFIIFITGATGITNLMFTAYFSRIREIGTIRALGGQKRTVIRLFAYEYSLLTFAGGAAGLLAALCITAVLNSLGIRIHNSILQMMLGSDIFGYSPSAGMAVLTVGLGIATGTVASLIPLLRTIRVQPVFAMQGGAY